VINGSTGNQSPECSPLGEDTKTPDGAVTVPVKKQRKGSRWRCSGVVTKAPSINPVVFYSAAKIRVINNSSYFYCELLKN
jgi:hypothetical protein